MATVRNYTSNMEKEIYNILDFSFRNGSTEELYKMMDDLSIDLNEYACISGSYMNDEEIKKKCDYLASEITKVFDDIRAYDEDTGKKILDEKKEIFDSNFASMIQRLSLCNTDWMVDVPMGVDGTPVYKNQEYRNNLNSSIFGNPESFKDQIKGLKKEPWEEIYDSIDISDSDSDSYQKNVETLYGYLQADPEDLDAWTKYAILKVVDSCANDDGEEVNTGELEVILQGCFTLERSYTKEVYVDHYVREERYLTKEYKKREMLTYLANSYQSIYSAKADSGNNAAQTGMVSAVLLSVDEYNKGDLKNTYDLWADGNRMHKDDLGKIKFNIKYEGKKCVVYSDFRPAITIMRSGSDCNFATIISHYTDDLLDTSESNVIYKSIGNVVLSNVDGKVQKEIFDYLTDQIGGTPVKIIKLGIKVVTTYKKNKKNEEAKIKKNNEYEEIADSAEIDYAADILEVEVYASCCEGSDEILIMNSFQNEKELAVKVAYANMIERKIAGDKTYSCEELEKRYCKIVEGCATDEDIEYIEEFSDVYDKNYNKYVNIKSFRDKVGVYLDKNGLDTNTATLEEMQEAIDKAVKYYEEEN